MNAGNIFSELNFKAIEPKDLIMKIDDISKVSNLFNNIFRNVGATEQVFITKTLEDEALAISTAEDSSLTPTEAANIKISDEQSLRILKYQKSDLSTEKKYEHLEYENIKNVSSQSTGIGFEHLNIEIVKQLHHDLTIGLDEYASKLQISKYHSGSLRQINTVKVGRFPPYEPPKHKKIKTLLEVLFTYFQQKKDITLIDIIEFGLLLYAIHPFQNGNKRIVRIIESALLNFYGYSAKKTLSLSRAYSLKKTGFNSFLLTSLNERHTRSFVNFTIRCYMDEGKRTMFNMINDSLENKFDTHILAYESDKKQEQYKKAFELLNKYPILKNSKFTELMGENGFSHSISQRILKKLHNENILSKTNQVYFFSDLSQYLKLNDFIEKHMIK